MVERIRAFFDEKRFISPGTIAIAGALLALLSLLSNNAGLAIIFASLVIPVGFLVEISRRDLIKDEPRWSTPAMLAWGIVAGIVMGIIGAAVAAEWWIEGAVLHVGAAGFGGEAADQEGSPGFAVLLLIGIVLPVLGVAFAALGPYWMRRYPEFRNEVMDGVSLGAAAGCGLATGSTIVFVWPLVEGGSADGGSVSDWTALLLGVLVMRPVIFGMIVSFVCGGIWHTAMTQRSVDLLLPVGIGLGGAIVYVFGDLLLQASGTRVELLWHIIIVIALLAAARIVLLRAIAQDRFARSLRGERITCPVCGATSPLGLFCAVCGARLQPATVGNDDTAPIPTLVDTAAGADGAQPETSEEVEPRP